MQLNRAQFAGWLSKLPDSHDFKKVAPARTPRCSWCPLAAWLNSRGPTIRYMVSPSSVYAGVPETKHLGALPDWAIKFVTAFDTAEREDRRADVWMAKTILNKTW